MVAEVGFLAGKVHDRAGIGWLNEIPDVTVGCGIQRGWAIAHKKGLIGQKI